MNKLRKYAALFGTLTLLTTPLLISSPAFAQSTSDYNKQVAAQQALISDLQTKLAAAQQQLTDLQNNSNGQADLINAAQTAATQAKDALDTAAADDVTKQANYDAAYADEQAAEQAVNDAITAVGVASDAVDSAYADYQAKQDASATAGVQMNLAQTAYDNSSVTVGGPSTPGLTVDVYTGINRNGNPPQKSDNAYTKCKTTTVTNIQANWGGGDIMGCGSDYVMLHYHGYITYPTTTKVYFMNQADDGFYMTIAGQPIVNDWSLKGCGANSAGLFSFTGGQSYAVDAWFYEWTGGACSTLYYQPLNSGQWTVAPASFFTQQVVAVTTKDPALKVVLDAKTATYNAAVAAEETALQTYIDAGNAYDQATLTYNQALDTLSAKQATLSSQTDILSVADATWQTASDDKAIKDAALLTLQTQYKATFDAINNQAGVVSGIETQLVQAKAALAAIPKPTSPAKVSKKPTAKPAPPAKVAPKPKFTPVPK
jgi:hypothetical protein